MAFTSSARITGGHKLKAVLDRAEQNKSKRAKQIKVGFFADAPNIPMDSRLRRLRQSTNTGWATTLSGPFFRQSPLPNWKRDCPRNLGALLTLRRWTLTRPPLPVSALMPWASSGAGFRI